MPTIFIALILGLIQGLTEFIPISSSAHLTIIPQLFNWPDPGLTFDVGLHLGTLAAVIIYFHKDLIKTDKDLFLKITLATIPGALAGYLLEHQAETTFRSPVLIAIAMICLGGILWIADKKHSSSSKDISKITLKEAIIIGASQAMAIIPGVSRSGITISCALFLNVKREDAAKFSFLLAIPIIMGAGVLKLPHLLKSHLSMDFFVGFIAAAISGFLSIKFLINYLQKNNYRFFVYYRFVFGILIILLLH